MRKITSLTAITLAIGLGAPATATATTAAPVAQIAITGVTGCSGYRTLTTVNMRATASLTGKVIGSIPKCICLGDKATTTYKTDGRGVRWAYVYYSGKSGYVSSINLDSGGGTTNLLPRCADSFQTTTTVNLRSSASLSGAVKRTIPKGVCLRSVESKVDGRGVRWWYVNYNGTYGYVSGANLK